MQRLLLGSYNLNRQGINVYVCLDDAGSSFTLNPGKGKLPEIELGLDCDDWYQILGALLHESFEYLMTTHNHRYSLSNVYDYNHGRYVFNFNHMEFQEICTLQAWFLQGVIPDLKRVYDLRAK